MIDPFEDDASVTTQTAFGSAPRRGRRPGYGVEIKAKAPAVVLAAGRSSRFHGATSKLVADFAGKPLIRHAVAAVTGSRASSTFVVTGYADEDIRNALEGMDVTFVHNERYETGLASSLRAGLRALPQDADGAVIALADMPKIASCLIDALIRTFESCGADAVAPVCDGRRGNPVLVSRRLFDRIAALSGDQGAKRLLEEPGLDIVQVAVSDAAIFFDVDRLEDIEEPSRL